MTEPSNLLRILLVDDHAIVRKGILYILESRFPEAIFEEASHAREALAKMQASIFDLVIVDIEMPEMDGIELMEKIHENCSEQKALALSMMGNRMNIQKMIRAGAMGYVLKEASPSELELAIKTILGGQPFYSPKVSGVIMNAMSPNKKIVNHPELSPRELEILRLIIEEKTNGEIASLLSISIRTVETHKHNILTKVGSRSIAGLVKFAIQQHLFPDLF